MTVLYCCLHFAQRSRAGPGNPNGDLIARDDTFKFEWSVGYHVELLDVLANDSGTGLRITNAKGAGMVGELGTSSTQVIYM
jgi:hypothetical protein